MPHALTTFLIALGASGAGFMTAAILCAAGRADERSGTK